MFMFVELWMVGVRRVPHSNQTSKQTLNHIMVRSNISLLLTQKALEGVGLIGWCGD
jgi:hypothetical protein